MDELTVTKKIEKLPPEAKKQAQDFVDFLYEQYVVGKTKTTEADSISESDFFGIWKNRDEMKDSTSWVKKVRKSQWPDT